MTRLNGLFLLALISIWVRYIVYGKFEISNLLLACAFPIASIVIYVIGKHVAKKEMQYVPKDIDAWSIYYAQRVIHTPKLLYEGSHQRGQYQRYYQKPWQRFVDDFVSSNDNWYLSFKIKIDSDLYDVSWARKKWFSKNEHWKFYKNGLEFGEAATNIDLKNTVKLREAMTVTLGEEEFEIHSYTVQGEARLLRDGEVLATIRRNHLISNVLVIDIPDEREELLVMVLLFRLYFK